MILTQKIYEKLWKNSSATGFGMPLHTIPSYHEYLQREVYQQDYLDLFKGKATFERITENGEFGVPLSIFKKMGVDINPCKPNVKKLDGADCLLVDYKFPYTSDDFKKVESSSIQYILIGEAAPPSTKAPLKKNTYFYNIEHLGSTSYFEAPCKAFDINEKSKRMNLIKLAERGVILFDLFPFSIDYEDIRDKIKELSISRFISIVSEIKCKYVCHENLKFSFLCSTGKDGHAEFIIDNVKHGVIALCSQKVQINKLSSLHWGSSFIFKPLELPRPLLKGLIGHWHPITEDAVIVGVKGKLSATNFKLKKPQGMINKYKSIGKILPNGRPHHISIRFSFDL